MRVFRAICAVIAAFGPVVATAQGRGLRVYISADLEGITGVVTDEQLGTSGFEYQRARQWMTDEVNAAISGAREAGATSFVISDSHGNGQNLLIDQLPDDVTIVRSWPRPLMMMEGIDSTFDAALFIGYHSSTSNSAGVRAHTMSSATLTGVSLNGTQVPEGGMNAAIAAYFGVPVVMISGDDAATNEQERFSPGIAKAVVKRAIAFHSAATMTPKAGQALIRAQTRAGIERRTAMQSRPLAGPITLEMSFKHYRTAEILTYLPIVTRVNAHTIRFIGKDIVEVSRFIEFVNTYATGLSP
jgi:D-amino peptidase